MVKGRLERESNPIPREVPGYVPQHDSTGNEDYVRTSPRNPFPTADKEVLEKLNAIDVVAEELKALNENNQMALTAYDIAVSAKVDADKVKGQGNHAEEQGNYAKNQGDYAQNAADNAVMSTNTFHDDDSNKTYNWGLKHSGEHMIFMYEEVK